jgi:hypothetical protein
MYLENPNVNDILYSIENQILSKNYFALLFIGENSQIDLNELATILSRKKIKFAGGIFPKVIVNNKTFSKGVIIKIIPNNTISIYFDTPGTFTRQISEISTSKYSTGYVLTSGMSANNSDDIRLLYSYLGNDVKLFGGGAGRTSNSKKSILFSNDGIFQSGTIVILTENTITSGSINAWKKLIGPFIATKTEKNCILELNWENAFPVYQRFLKEAINIQVDRRNFEQLAIHYPFGIYKESMNYIIRDPISVSQEGYLECAGNVAQNSLLDLMTITKEGLESVPKKLLSQSISENQRLSDALIFDCISREKHLNSAFFIELGQISNEIKNCNNQVDLEGVLSIGEIHCNGEDYPEILNKSIVIGFSYFD